MVAILKKREKAETPPQHSLGHLAIGYPRLAGQMEKIPETSIYRRFGALNARNLLYYQAELASLEKELIQQENEDSGKVETSRYALDWYWLSVSSDNEQSKQLDLVMRMRTLLKEYNDALLQQSKIHKLHGPDNWDLHDLQYFLHTQEMGPLALIGDDATIWGSVVNPESHSIDLITLKPRKKADPLSKWLLLKSYLILTPCGLFGRQQNAGAHRECIVQDSFIYQVTRWIATILASLIPLASVVMLYLVHDTHSRFAIMGSFNLLISACLSALTRTKRAEIFAVSAALTAVQVVFIGTERT